LIISSGHEIDELLKDFVVLNDGIALDAAGWLLNGKRFEENLNGTDLTPRLLCSLPEGAQVFLYGAKPDVVKRAAERFGNDGVAICGFRDGYSCSGSEAAEAARLAGAEVVLVALGNPRQERWIVKHGDASGARLFLGVGALFDFMSGAAVRAPRIFRALRLEWLFRLLREPRRLGRRYTVEMAQFFRLVLRERRRRRR
jgi:beta-1,4-glucosyltransferase